MNLIANIVDLNNIPNIVDLNNIQINDGTFTITSEQLKSINQNHKV